MGVIGEGKSYPNMWLSKLNFSFGGKDWKMTWWCVQKNVTGVPLLFTQLKKGLVGKLNTLYAVTAYYSVFYLKLLCHIWYTYH